MTLDMHESKYRRFFEPVGYRKDGRPIFPIAGGDGSTPPPDAPQTTPSTPEPRFTEADLARVRQEEKDKVYGRLDQERQSREALERQVADLLKSQQDREAAEAAARQQAEEEARRKAEEELSAKDLLAQREQEFNSRLADATQTWEQKFQQMQQEREQERALLEKDKELANLQAYTQRRVTEEADNIAPQLLEFVTGNSTAEIDASIERVKAKSNEIALAAAEAIQAQQQTQRRGVSPTGYAPTGPMEIQGGQRQYSAEDIKNMSMQEYAEFRAKALGGIAQANNQRGLYG
jgi:hypothetical protein